MELSSCCNCIGRFPDVFCLGSDAGGAFSLFVESLDPALF